MRSMRSMLLFLLFSFFVLSSADAGTVLRAKSLSGGQWYQRVDSGLKPVERFKAEVAVQFKVSEADVVVIVSEMTEAERVKVVEELASGIHEGIGVIAAPAPSMPGNPDADLRKKIEAATTIGELKDALLGKTGTGRVMGTAK